MSAIFAILVFYSFALTIAEQQTTLYIIDFPDTTTEKRMGMGSILNVRCECGITTEVRTGKQHYNNILDGKTKVKIFDANTKLAGCK